MSLRFAIESGSTNIGDTVDIVQTWKNGIAWYQPTTDTYDWKYFYDNCYSINYATATAETLKRVAWQSAKLEAGEDTGMWTDRKLRLEKFLNSDIALSDYDPLLAEAIQYEFVACFLNDYSRAAHNEDLWKSINDSAVKVLKQNIVPMDAAALARYSPPRSSSTISVSPKWLLTAIPLIIYNAFKTVNLSYYRPTEDTDTWAYFQNIVFDLTLLDSFQMAYRHTYLLTNIKSSVDEGIWSTLATAATTFLNANLGKPPADAKSQAEFAISFCNLFKFNYRHAAHNADLFKAYNTSFTAATDKLQMLIK